MKKLFFSVVLALTGASVAFFAPRASSIKVEDFEDALLLIHPVAYQTPIGNFHPGSWATWDTDHSYATFQPVSGNRSKYTLSRLGPLVDVPVTITLIREWEGDNLRSNAYLSFDGFDPQEGLRGVDANGDSIRVRAQYGDYTPVPTNAAPDGEEGWEYLSLKPSPKFANYTKENLFLSSIKFAASSTGTVSQSAVISQHPFSFAYIDNVRQQRELDLDPVFEYIQQDSAHLVKTMQNTYQSIDCSLYSPNGCQEYFDLVKNEPVNIPIYGHTISKSNLDNYATEVHNFFGIGEGKTRYTNSSHGELGWGNNFYSQTEFNLTFPASRAYHADAFVCNYPVFEYTTVMVNDTLRAARKFRGGIWTKFEPSAGTVITTRNLHYKRFGKSLWDNQCGGDLHWRAAYRIDIDGPWEYNEYGLDSLTYLRTVARGDSMKITYWAWPYVTKYPHVLRSNTVQRYGYDPSSTERAVYVGGKLQLGTCTEDYDHAELYLYPEKLQGIQGLTLDDETGLAGAVNITDDITLFEWPVADLGELPADFVASQKRYARTKLMAAPDADGYIYYNQLVPAEKLAAFENGQIPSGYSVFAKVYYDPKSELTPTFHALGYAVEPTTAVPGVLDGDGAEAPHVVADYDVSGRAVSPDAPGVHITRYSDGTVRKRLVR